MHVKWHLWVQLLRHIGLSYTQNVAVPTPVIQTIVYIVIFFEDVPYVVGIHGNVKYHKNK